MTVDLNNYTILIPTLRIWLDSQRDKKVTEIISDFALTTNCPLIAVCHYVIHIQGTDASVDHMIESLTKFYGYENIIPLKETL